MAAAGGTRAQYDARYTHNIHSPIYIHSIGCQETLCSPYHWAKGMQTQAENVIPKIWMYVLDMFLCVLDESVNSGTVASLSDVPRAMPDAAV